jgi:hypothetical protein
MDTFLKVVAIIIFAPVVIGFAAQAFVVALTAIFPYVLLFAVTIGGVAGLAAGFVLRHRLSQLLRQTDNQEFPIPPPEPTRRPRGPRRRED